MKKPIRILLQTTIPYTEDDWHIGRFSLLRKHLESLADADGAPLYEVTARDIEKTETGDDVILSRLHESDFAELWLFAVDTGDGLSVGDCTGITKFRQRGGGIFSTRDHQDLGSSLCTLGGVGAAHYFHSKQNDPRAERNRRDDAATGSIDFPNYHSGANGDYQIVEAIEPVHRLLKKPGGETIGFFPAHPHEGGVGRPGTDESARVIARGKSLVTNNDFNLVVAFERSIDHNGFRLGRAIAESSFHHLVDYNWDIDAGCPPFVEEPPGDGFKNCPEALEEIKIYAANLAAWLAPEKFSG